MATPWCLTSRSTRSSRTASWPYSDGYQQFSGDWTASSELSDTSTMPSGSNSWTLSSVNGDSSYDGDSDWGYYFTKADESNLPDGYVRSTDSESGEISTVFEFGMSASLDDGAIAWTGTGGANTDTVTDDNYLYNSRQTTDTAVNGFATDYQQDYDETVNTDYDSDIGTNYSLLPNGQWEAISVNSSNDGTAYAVGTYDIGQTETNPDGTEDIVIDHVVQSYNYFYSGDAHESWDAQGDPTISSGTGGGGTATGAQTFRETNDSPEGFQTYSSQTFAYTQSWSKQYTTDDGESDVIRENNDRDYGAVIIDPYGSVSSITRHYATSDSGFDNGYADLGLFARNGPFTSYSKGFWSSDVQPPLSPWAGYDESGLASNVTPTAFTPMGGISNASPNIIQPTTNVPMPAPAGHNTAGSPANAGSFQYTDNQLNNGWGWNFLGALFQPSSFGTAESSVTTPTSLKVAQGVGIIGLSVVTGGLAGEAAAGYIGAGAAATWGGTFLTGLVGGGAGGFVQNGLTQVFSDQPINYKELGGAVIAGALSGGTLNVAFKGIGVGYQFVKGLMSDAAINVASDAASNAVAGQVTAAGAGTSTNLALDAEAGLVRSLRALGTKEALATASAIKNGVIKVTFVDSLRDGANGLFTFGTNVIQILKSVSSEEAAGIAAHEFKHFLDNLSEATYTVASEMAAYRFQAAALGKAFDEAATLRHILTHPAYRNLAR